MKVLCAVNKIHKALLKKKKMLPHKKKSVAHSRFDGCFYPLFFW